MNLADWDGVNPECKEKVVEFLRDYLKEAAPSFREAIAANPKDWWAKGGWHFGQGMSIRNALRDAGFTEDKMSFDNWDDYYVEAIEDALNESL